jgi:PAS domain S-box-containing protein
MTNDPISYREQAESLRAGRLFSEERRSAYRNTDRLFAILLPLQWVASGILGAVFLESDSHIQTAVFLGGIITLPPFLLTIFFPGRAVTRYSVGVGQILISALILHATGNRVESYFHLFGSLAFLSFYRDWKLLSVAGLIALFNQPIGAALLPGIKETFDTASWVELAGWMIFENIFLIAWIRASVKSMRQTGARTAALEENEERYRAIVEQTSESIALIDPETLKVLECNKAFSHLLGYNNTDEIAALNVRDFSTASDEQLASLITSFREGSIASGERTYRRRDGSKITVEASGSLIRYGGRTVICTAFKDLTERKKADTEMQRLALVAQRTQNAVIVCAPNGEIQWVNEGFIRVTGYQPDEVVGRHPINILCGEETDRKTLAAILTAVNAQLPFDGEIYNYKKDGSGYWSAISLTPILDDKGNLQGSISIETDITERKKMEVKLRTAYEELEQRVFERTADLVRANKVMHLEISERKKAEVEVRNAREFLKKIIDTVPTLIAVRDTDNRFTLANNAFAKMLGTSIEEMIGKTPDHFHHDPDELRKIQEQDEFVFHQWFEKPAFEEKYTDSAGETHYLETIKRPLIGDDGEKNILIIANDLTDRRSLEGQLRHAQKLESIGQLAAGIAHEINTPTQYVADNIRFLDDSHVDVTSVLNKYREFLHAVENGSCQPAQIAELKKEIENVDLEYIMQEVPTAISQSLEGVSRIAKIVQSMKDFAHPGSTEKTAVDLNKAIESTITVARNEWKYVADVETKLDETLPHVPCIIGELNQVILNMIINAAHAIRDIVGEGVESKGKITISTHLVKDDWVEVRIKDTGTGIPLRIQNRVFDPFFTTKEIGKGSGQGLAISHTVVVDKHGGKLTFETEEQKGTTFIIGLPITTDEHILLPTI